VRWAASTKACGKARQRGGSAGLADDRVIRAITLAGRGVPRRPSNRRARDPPRSRLQASAFLAGRWRWQRWAGSTRR
jgi:hypothetical protein